MNESVFVDTNVLVYAFLDNDITKHKQAVALLSQALNTHVFVSSVNSTQRIEQTLTIVNPFK